MSRSLSAPPAQVAAGQTPRGARCVGALLRPSDWTSKAADGSSHRSDAVSVLFAGGPAISSPAPGCDLDRGHALAVGGGGAPARTSFPRAGGAARPDRGVRPL